LGGADLLTHDDEFPHQFPETTVFSDLCFGTLDGRALGDNLSDGFSGDPVSQ